MTDNGYRFFGGNDKNVLIQDSGDGCTTLQIYKKAVEVYTLKG